MNHNFRTIDSSRALFELPRLQESLQHLRHNLHPSVSQHVVELVGNAPLDAHLELVQFLLFDLR